MEFKKRILVAPLNWGLGHATRCIPIINALLENNFEPIIASDGIALELLKKEFPNLKAMELPSYNITYPKNGKNFKLKLIIDSPKWLKAIKKEKAFIKNLITEGSIDGIISDNRLGIYSKKIPSVFISHQLNVLSGNTTWFSSKIHQNIIKKYDECWVPDLENEPNLSGELGHLNNSTLKLKYIGPLSRFNKIDCEVIYNLTIILSGPEPQRSILEKKLFEDIKDCNKNILFIKGVIEEKQTVVTKGNVTIYNYMTSIELEKAINQSDTILARSGYTTIMDVSKLEKKAFFIPTPGQFEQEYLAKRLEKSGLTPFCKQDDFNIEMLKQVDYYCGLSVFNYEVNYNHLFSLFQGERKLTTNS